MCNFETVAHTILFFFVYYVFMIKLMYELSTVAIVISRF